MLHMFVGNNKPEGPFCGGIHVITNVYANGLALMGSQMEFTKSTHYFL